MRRVGVSCNIFMPFTNQNVENKDTGSMCFSPKVSKE